MDKKEAIRYIIYNLKEIESTRLRLTTAKSENVDIEIALLNQEVLNLYRLLQNYQSGLYASQPVEAPIIQKEIPRTLEPAVSIAAKSVSIAEPVEQKQEETDLKRNAKDAQLRKERLRRVEVEAEMKEKPIQKEELIPAPKGESEEFSSFVEEKTVEAEIAEDAAKISGIPIRAPHPTESSPEPTLNEKLQSSSKVRESLNEKFAHNDTPKTIADKLKTGPITDLKSAMAINQKIAFTKSLFGGDDKEFKKALNFLNNCTNYSEAKMYLQSDLGKRYNWSDSDPLVTEFTEIVYRKFI